jgi:hypothetical protein
MSRALPLTFVAICLTATPAFAHHSYAAFDREHPVTIEGDVAEVVYANPHVVLTIRAADATYTVEWRSLFQLAGRYHVVKDTLAVGDRLVVTARATRDRSEHRLSLVTDVRRPVDGWSWSRPLLQLAQPNTQR